MKHYGYADKGAKTRRVRPITGYEFHKGEWMESSEHPTLSPTVFLVEQPPNSTLYSHWHGENQFQVFTQGSGKIGKDTLQPVVVQYAGAYTGYGPLIAGEEGLSYFTVRAVFETGSMRTMDKMVRGPKRHAVGGPHPPTSPDVLKKITEVQSNDLIALADDGLCARAIRVPPNASTQGMDPSGAGGQFYMVLQGTMDCGDTQLKQWEQVFISADEKPMDIRAGADGLEVLFLQIPVKEQVYVEAKEKALASAAA